MTAALTALSLPATTQPIREKPNQFSIIRQVAMQALKELALALAITLICIPFTASGAWVMMGAVAIFGVALNTIFHCACIYLNERKLGQSGLMFYPTAGVHGEVLIHEGGHYLMANHLFKTQAHIRYFPFEGGVTSYTAHTLTSAGQKLGYRRSIFLITLAGPALAVLSPAISLIAGLALFHSHPHAASLCLGFASCVFINHAAYAYSGLSAPTSNLSHDFVRLRTFGLHPLAACAGIVAIPIIITAGYFLRRHLQSKLDFVRFFGQFSQSLDPDLFRDRESGVLKPAFAISKQI